MSNRLLIIAMVVIGLILIALTGCTGDAPPCPTPPVQVRVVTVDRPVPTPCVDVTQIPVAPPTGLDLTGDAAHDADLLAAQDLALRKALGVSLALLGACVR
jgi:hypothetical protein